MASTMELEAQEMVSLLDREPRPASRMSGHTRIVSAIGATILLAIGGKAAWGGMPISDREVLGAWAWPEGGCSDSGDDCSTTQCCNDPGMKCWRKNDHWSSCNATCDSNMKWEEDGWVRKEEHVWDCHQLSAANNGENCLYSNQCVDDDSHCFKKDEKWATCNKTCNSKMAWENGTWAEQDDDVWDCHILSAADDGVNCLESKTCKNPQSHCFLKDEHWAACNATCSPNNKWSNESNTWEQTKDPVWNCKTLSCVDDGHNCLDSRCCKAQGSTCYKKDDGWAACNATCVSSYKWISEEEGWKDQGEGEKVWSCEELRPMDHDDTPPCDLSPCDGCQGEQCDYCRVETERDCCLEISCKGSQGEQVAKCKQDNLATCCEGMADHCSSADATTAAPEPEGTNSSAAPEGEGTTAPEAEGTTSPEAEGTTEPDVEGTAALEVEGTMAPEAEGTTAPEAEGTAAPDAEGTSPPEVEGTAAPEVEGTTAPEAEGTTAPEAEGTTAPKDEKTTTPGAGPAPEAEGTTAPEVEGTVAPEVEGTAAPEVGGTAAPEVEGTTAPEAEGTGAPEAAGPLAPGSEPTSVKKTTTPGSGSEETMAPGSEETATPEPTSVTKTTTPKVARKTGKSTPK